jgi:NAD(P)-dependent dehydrogenase (short-subunit alcohol dehydrogenase family)
VWAAGAVRYTAIEAVLEAELRAGLELNLVAPYLLAQDASAAMKEAGGAIVLVASTLAFSPAPSTSVYSAAKGGLVALARSLAVELAPAIRVNAVAPGVIDTDMVRVPRLRPGEPEPSGAARDARVTAELEALRALHPAGRLGRPEEVAGGVLYLLDAAFVTGTVLTIDGGLTVR